MTTTNPPADLNLEAERAEFEAFITADLGGGEYAALMLQRTGGASYNTTSVQASWSGWVAHARRAAIKESPATQEAIRNAALEEAAHLADVMSAANAVAHRPTIKAHYKAAANSIRFLKSHPPAPVDGAVPEGWKLVPIEPTEEIVVAIEAAIDSQLVASAIRPIDMFRQAGEDIYAAMIDAAPTKEAK